jgi:integrase/recombinase XerD
MTADTSSHDRIEADITDRDIIEYAKDLQSRVGEGENQLTHRSYKRYLTDLRWLDDHLAEQDCAAADVGPREAKRIMRALSAYNGTTGPNRWRAISRFFDQLVKYEVIDENPCERWDLKDVGMSDSTAQYRYINDAEEGQVYAPSDKEIEQMINNVRSTQDRTRDQLIILLLYHTGCRATEFRNIRLDDVDRDAREIRLRKSITKNHKPRTVRYGESVEGPLHEWLDNGYRARLKHQDSPYLIITQKSGQISKSAINDIVKIAAQNAGINEPLYEDAAGMTRWKITGHSLRHACATRMIENGADIYRVSKYLGHSSVQITERTYVSDKDRLGVEEAHDYGPQ